MLALVENSKGVEFREVLLAHVHGEFTCFCINQYRGHWKWMRTPPKHNNVKKKTRVTNISPQSFDPTVTNIYVNKRIKNNKGKTN